MEKILKSIGNVLLFILLFIWQLPQNIIALCMMPFLGKLRLISYKKFCFAFEGSRMSGGISLGNFAFLSKYSAPKAPVVAHEQEGHTWDSKVMGPLYLFIIGIPSICAAMTINDMDEYYQFYTERWANEHAGLEVLHTESGRPFLSFKETLKYV